jgi:hypothetical protein
MLGGYSDRKTSDFPLSIGTGLAMRSLYNSTMDSAAETSSTRPTIPDGLDSLHVNVSTIARNLSNATGQYFIDANERETADIIEYEMAVMIDVSKGGLQPTFYFRDYDKLREEVKNYGGIRSPQTPKAKRVDEKMFHALNRLQHHSKIPIIEYGKLPVGGKVLMYTHWLHDLLNFKTQRGQWLLESHTGLIKGREVWGSKYHKVPGTDLSFLPFTHLLLRLFGDSNLYRPVSMPIRTEILKAAIQNKWSPVTTPRTVVDTVRAIINDPYLEDALAPLYRKYTAA